MCGRFTSARKRQELLEEFRIERDRVTEALEADYNVAPTKPVYAVLTRGQHGGGQAAGQQSTARPGNGGRGSAASKAARGSVDSGAAATDQDVARELRVLRWGLVPSWAKDPSIGSRLINARAETVDSKPSFRRAFARRRCLLPADGFYEWIQVSEDGRTRKQPYYIHRADGGILAFAGLYELWRDKSLPEDHPQAWLWTAVIITTRAEDEVGRIHDRMPMVIEPAQWDAWLDPGNTGASALHPLLAPATAGRLASYPVSMRVNSVRNNGPGLIEPLPPEANGEAGPGGSRGAGGAASVKDGRDGRSSGRAGGGRSTGGPMAAGPGGEAMPPGRSERARHRLRRPVTAPLTLF